MSYDRLLQLTPEQAGPCKRSCRTYVDKYFAGNVLDEPAASGGATRTKLDFAMCMLLIWLVKMRPDSFLHEYRTKFWDLVGIDVSESAICKALQRMKLALKKARRRRQNKYLRTNIAYYHQYLAGIATIDHGGLRFFDESAVSSREDECRRLHRSLVGTAVEAVLPNNQSYRLSVNGLTSAVDVQNPLTWDIVAVSCALFAHAPLWPSSHDLFSRRTRPAGCTSLITSSPASRAACSLRANLS